VNAKQQDAKQQVSQSTAYDKQQQYKRKTTTTTTATITTILMAIVQMYLS